MESETKSPESSVQYEEKSHQNQASQNTKCFLLEENRKIQRDIQHGKLMIKELGEIIHDILSSLIVAESAYQDLYITYKIELVQEFEEKYEWINQCCFCGFEESKSKLHDRCFKEDSPKMNDVEKLLSQLLSIFEKTFHIDNLGQTEDSELNRLWSELSLARQQINNLEIDKAQAFIEINDLKQIEEHTKSDFEDLQQKYERSQRSLRSLEKVLGEKDEGNEQILREVVELKRMVDELEEEKSRARREVVDLEFDLKKANDKIASLKNKRDALSLRDSHSDVPFQVDIRHFEGPQLLNVKSNLLSNDTLHMDINKTDGTLIGAMWSNLSLNREKISCLEKKINLAKQRLNVLQEKQSLLKGSSTRSFSINSNGSFKGAFANIALPNSSCGNGLRKKNERKCPTFASARNAKAA